MTTIVQLTSNKGQTQFLLKKCKWCGKLFFKYHNRQEYCSNTCSTYAHMEQKAEYNHKYRKQYSLDEKTRNGLGSGFLGGHRHDDVEKELSAIQKEMKRLKIKLK